MILVVGGRASGKKEYVQKLGYGPAQMSGNPYGPEPVMLDLQALFFIDSTEDTSNSNIGEEFDEKSLISALLQKEVVCCDLVGGGVVPMAAAEREAREIVGRLCITLAAQAETVVHMVCGIPEIIKGKGE